MKASSNTRSGRRRLKALIGTVAMTAALSGSIQAAIPATAAAQPKADAATCEGYYRKYLFYSGIGVTSWANFYLLLFDQECALVIEGPEMEV
jgi:hypothetical protein